VLASVWPSETGLPTTGPSRRLSRSGISDFGVTSAKDDAGHGTHVGGIVAATKTAASASGVAPGATLYAVKA
jgi:subtilisin family serine protease